MMAYRNAGKRGYKSLLSAIAAAMVISSPTMAQPKFDKRIAQAAADQVAKKLGTLRDGFKLNEEPELVDSDNNPVSKLSYGFKITRISRATRHTQHKTVPRAMQRYEPGKVRVVHAGLIAANSDEKLN